MGSRKKKKDKNETKKARKAAKKPKTAKEATDRRESGVAPPPADDDRRQPGRSVRCGLIQSSCPSPDVDDPERIRAEMIAKHVAQIERAAREGVEILCLQELFCAPYFAAEQDPRWYALAESVPGGPATRVIQSLARTHQMVIVAPVYEAERTGVYFNCAAVFDADGSYLGKYRKAHIPQCWPGFWEKFYFTPGNLGFPVFRTRFGTIGVYICYDRHFPEGARALGLAGAEIVFVPSATTAGHSEYLWRLEQPAMAVANGYFVGSINRVGWEEPWRIGEFYGSSYFCDPRGTVIAEASRDEDELLVCDLDLSMIDRTRTQWQFFRDRRPDLYGVLGDETCM